MNIDVISFAVGFLLGLAFYLLVAVIVALLMVNNRDDELSEINNKLYEKKLRDAGYNDDIFC